MKRIYLYPIKSILSNDYLISKDSEELINKLKQLNPPIEFKIVNDFFHKDGLFLILVQSGGSENYFKEHIFSSFAGPYYLLTYGSCNSLAASLEILTFIKQNNRCGEVLHGNVSYINNRIRSLIDIKQIKHDYLGIIGKPSDWLISSDVDYQKCLDKFGLELIDIDEKEVIDVFNSIENVKETDFDFDKNELSKALRLKEALQIIIDKYHLKGITIRCFDLLSKIKTSACMSLALLNDLGITSICEGDIPSLISAHLVNNLLDTLSFQANPQYIDPANNIIEFAHCTIPFKMCRKYNLDTHFESNSAVGIHGEMKITNVTVYKINSELNEFYVSEGVILNNDYRRDRCRTQIRIQLDSSVNYFLKSSLGNHHLIIYGNHKEEIKNYFESFGLREVV